MEEPGVYNILVLLCKPSDILLIFLSLIKLKLSIKNLFYFISNLFPIKNFCTFQTSINFNPPHNFNSLIKLNLKPTLISLLSHHQDQILLVKHKIKLSSLLFTHYSFYFSPFFPIHLFHPTSQLIFTTSTILTINQIMDFPLHPTKPYSSRPTCKRSKPTSKNPPKELPKRSLPL